MISSPVHQHPRMPGAPARPRLEKPASPLTFGRGDGFGTPVLSRPDYVYHFTTRRAWKQILASGGLKPKRFGEPGTFVLSWDNLTQDWTRPTRYLGSALQSFMIDMRSAVLNSGQSDDEILLLRIKVAPGDLLWARDIGPIFNRLDLGRWLGSVRPLQNFRLTSDTIPELIIANPASGLIPVNRVEIFRRIPVSTIPAEISQKKIDPSLVLQHILNPEQGPIPVAADARPMHFKRTFLLGAVKNPLNTVRHFYAKLKS